MYRYVLVCTCTYRYIRFCPILYRCIGFQMPTPPSMLTSPDRVRRGAPHHGGSARFNSAGQSGQTAVKLAWSSAAASLEPGRAPTRTVPHPRHHTRPASTSAGAFQCCCARLRVCRRAGGSIGCTSSLPPLLHVCGRHCRLTAASTSMVSCSVSVNARDTVGCSKWSK